MARLKFSPVIKAARFNSRGFSPTTMLTFGHTLNNSIAARFDRGQDVNDLSTPALTEKYRIRKGKRGGSDLRDMNYTGRTRRAMQPLSAATNLCIIGFSDPVAEERIKLNSRIIRQYGVSPTDHDTLMKAIRAASDRVVEATSVGVKSA